MPRLLWYHRAAPLLLALGIALPTAVAAQGVEAPRIPLRTALMEVSTIRTEYADAFNRKDLAALANVYAQDAVFLDGTGEKVMGAAAIRDHMAADSAEWGHMLLTADTTYVYGNTAVDVGTVTVHPSGGGEETANYLTVLRRGMAGWKIVSVALVPKMDDE